MAVDFCLRHGLLPRERATKLAAAKASAPKAGAGKPAKSKAPAGNGKGIVGPGAKEKKRKPADQPQKPAGGATKPGPTKVDGPPAKKKPREESDSDDDIPLAAL